MVGSIIGDIVGSITGSIVEAFFGMPKEMRAKAMKYLPEELIEVMREFERKYQQ